jgi:tetratricopeptide (TPR) repeat protein
MASPGAYTWEFRARFRRHAFGWKSQPAIKRINEAVSEIKKVARQDKVLAAEGAVLFLEKVSPALEQVDSSSGAIGTAVNRAIAALVSIIAAAPAPEKTRDTWLDRLWEAFQEDQIPYIERLGDYWGDLCVSKETASRWADQLMGGCQTAWRPDSNARGFFAGATNCLSALLAAERYDDLIQLLEMAPSTMWHYRQYGVKALAALGRKAEAIQYAEQGRELNDSPIAIARACEEMLLSSGFLDEAYERYGLLANQASTYTAWFRAVAKKYPHRKPAEILADLVAETPGEEGKWFAAAKDAKLFDEAIALANQSPCSPQTLTRAARDFEDTKPEFAIEAGMAALHWLVKGYGYDITGLDVLNAYSHTTKAADNAGCAEETHQRIHDVVAQNSLGARFVTRVLGRHLELS